MEEVNKGKWKFVIEPPGFRNVIVLAKGAKLVLPEGQEFQVEQTIYLQVLRLEYVREKSE